MQGKLLPAGRGPGEDPGEGGQMRTKHNETLSKETIMKLLTLNANPKNNVYDILKINAYGFLNEYVFDMRQQKGEHITFILRPE